MKYRPPFNDYHYRDLFESTLSEVREIEKRLAKIEAVIEVLRDKDSRQLPRSRRTSDGFFEAMRDYWHFLAVVASLITFIVTHFFGVGH